MLSFNFVFLHLISKQWNSPGEASLFPRKASVHTEEAAFGIPVAVGQRYLEGRWKWRSQEWRQGGAEESRCGDIFVEMVVKLRRWVRWSEMSEL